MKKLSYLFGVLAVLTMVVSLLPAAALAAPPATEDRDPTLQWATFKVPDRFYQQFVVPSYAPSFEVTSLAIGSDGKTFYAVDANYPGDQFNLDGENGLFNLYKSTNAGVSWSDKTGRYVYQAYQSFWADTVLDEEADNFRIWSVYVAPDDPNFVIAVTGIPSNLVVPNDWAADAPVDIWVSSNGGLTWSNANVTSVAPALDMNIGAVAISPSYGAGRSVAVGYRDPTDAANAGAIVTMEAGATIPGWRDQGWAPADRFGGDVFAIKFSPNYSGDFAYFVVSTDADNLGGLNSDGGVYLHVGFRNVRTNQTMNWDNGIGPQWTGFPREIAVNAGDSPDETLVVTADLDMPSDFNGDDARLRKFFVSYDAPQAAGAVADVYRLDNTTVYKLNVPVMIASPIFSNKRISTIAYYGTTTQGKLLAGEVLGNQCSATVLVWYTLDPLACPSPCWQQSWKPPTGGASTDCESGVSYGNAQVAWSPDGKRGYAGTGYHMLDNYPPLTFPLTHDYTAFPSIGDPLSWPQAYADGRALDESAFSITRNDGITWSQISLIDTKIDRYTDVAPALDCTKVYLTSMNFGVDGLLCSEFDSIWMSPNADFAGTQLGTTWERILTIRTTDHCADADGNHAILRLAPDKTDGSVVFWAAGGSEPIPGGANKQLIMWSEDGGDIWYPIRPTGGTMLMTVQDISVESASVLYVLNRNAQVLKMVYARPNWKNADTSVYPSDVCLTTAKSIASILAGTDEYVIVGGSTADGGSAKISLSANGGKTWTQTPTGTPTASGESELHVAFDPAFKDNKMFYAGVAGWGDGGWNGTGGLYRWTWGVSTLWDDIGVGSAGTGSFASNKSPGAAQGVALDSGGTLYATDYNPNLSPDSGVKRTTNPRRGQPKPGVSWDRLTVGLPESTGFTMEPQNVKLCGCMPNISNVTIWVIDASLSAGTLGNYTSTLDYRHTDPQPAPTEPHSDYTSVNYVYVFIDCLAKVAPAVTGPDVVGCDPVSGRNQEVNISWEQPCLATVYKLTISKDEAGDFELASWGSITPANVVAPKFIIPTNARFTMTNTEAGEGSLQGTSEQWITPLECGHKYYYVVQVTGAVTGQAIKSKSSAVKSFTVKSGLPISSPYLGLQLLAPANAAAAVPTKPVSFSWSPYIDATEYQFQLSKANDPTMAAPLVDAKTATTAYAYTSALDYSTNYFWRVRESAPFASDWSPVFSFMTEKAPAPVTTPAPIVIPPAPTPTPSWAWVIIALGAILVIVVLILIVRTRRA